MNKNTTLIEEYQAQSKAAKDELVRLMREREQALAAVTEQARRLSDCAWADYFDRLNALKAQKRAVHGRLKFYLDHTTDTAEVKEAHYLEYTDAISDIDRQMTDLRGDYQSKVRQIADDRKNDYQRTARMHDWKIRDQEAIIRALRDAYLKRLEY